MSPVDIAYEILKDTKDWDLRSFDERGAMCVTAGEYIAEDPKFANRLHTLIKKFGL